jgi:hypothetical protein
VQPSDFVLKERTSIWRLELTHENAPVILLYHIWHRHYISEFASDVQKYGLAEAALRSFDVRQQGRAEEDGVIVAQLGERLLSQAFATYIETPRCGIGPDHLEIGEQSEHRAFVI